MYDLPFVAYYADNYWIRLSRRWRICDRGCAVRLLERLYVPPRVVDQILESAKLRSRVPVLLDLRLIHNRQQVTVDGVPTPPSRVRRLLASLCVKEVDIILSGLRAAGRILDCDWSDDDE